jgi:hypothetical protein
VFFLNRLLLQAAHQHPAAPIFVADIERRRDLGFGHHLSWKVLGILGLRTADSGAFNIMAPFLRRFSTTISRWASICSTNLSTSRSTSEAKAPSKRFES